MAPLMKKFSYQTRFLIKKEDSMQEFSIAIIKAIPKLERGEKRGRADELKVLPGSIKVLYMSTGSETETYLVHTDDYRNGTFTVETTKLVNKGHCNGAAYHKNVLYSCDYDRSAGKADIGIIDYFDKGIMNNISPTEIYLLRYNNTQFEPESPFLSEYGELLIAANRAVDILARTPQVIFTHEF